MPLEKRQELAVLVQPLRKRCPAQQAIAAFGKKAVKTLQAFAKKAWTWNISFGVKKGAAASQGLGRGTPQLTYARANLY